MWLPYRRRTAVPDGKLAALAPAAARYVVIDTELTGLDERRDSIVSLGALRVTEGRIDLADRFYEEVQPACALTAESILLHGITPQQVRDRPAIGSVLGEFAAFCGADLLVGHFIELDLAFLRRELERAGLPALAAPALDTWPLYDWMSGHEPQTGSGLPALKDPRLPELARALGVPCGGGHHALTDAFVTAQVFQRLLRRLERWDITTTGQLLRVADPRRATQRPRETAAPLA